MRAALRPQHRKHFRFAQPSALMHDGGLPPAPPQAASRNHAPLLARCPRPPTKPGPTRGSARSPLGSSAEHYRARLPTGAARALSSDPPITHSPRHPPARLSLNRRVSINNVIRRCFLLSVGRRSINDNIAYGPRPIQGFRRAPPSGPPPIRLTALWTRIWTLGAQGGRGGRASAVPGV